MLHDFQASTLTDKTNDYERVYIEAQNFWNGVFRKKNFFLVSHKTETTVDYWLKMINLVSLLQFIVLNT